MHKKLQLIFLSLQKAESHFITSNVLSMSEKEIKRLTDLAKERLKKQFSRDEVLHTFVMAGILDSKGRFTDNYPHLSTAIDAKS